jgi:hypothetical protein
MPGETDVWWYAKYWQNFVRISSFGVDWFLWNCMCLIPCSAKRIVCQSRTFLERSAKNETYAIYGRYSVKFISDGFILFNFLQELQFINNAPSRLYKMKIEGLEFRRSLLECRWSTLGVFSSRLIRLPSKLKTFIHFLCCWHIVRFRIMQPYISSMYRHQAVQLGAPAIHAWKPRTVGTSCMVYHFVLYRKCIYDPKPHPEKGTTWHIIHEVSTQRTAVRRWAENRTLFAIYS